MVKDCFPTVIMNEESGSHHFYSKWYWRSEPPEIKQEKKWIQVRKEETELSVFTCDVILYVENPKRFTNQNQNQTKNNNPTPKLWISELTRL